MYYCPDCFLANETGCCRACGKENLTEAGAEDFCYLTTQKEPWAGMLQEVLKDSGIAVMCRPVHGAWLTAYFGNIAEETEFFVPYEKLAAAQQLVEELLDSGEADEAEE